MALSFLKRYNSLFPEPGSTGKLGRTNILLQEIHFQLSQQIQSPASIHNVFIATIFTHFKRSLMCYSNKTVTSVYILIPILFIYIVNAVLNGKTSRI